MVLPRVATKKPITGSKALHTPIMIGAMRLPLWEISYHKIKITRIASTAPILSSQIKDEWIEVADINYAAHYKIAKPTSMRVTYKCEGKEYNEWICFEHTGYPRQKAEQWWMKRVVGVQIVPKNVKDAMDRKDFIKKPSHIRVRPDGKYFSIVGYKFE